MRFSFSLFWSRTSQFLVPMPNWHSLADKCCIGNWNHTAICMSLEKWMSLDSLGHGSRLGQSLRSAEGPSQRIPLSGWVHKRIRIWFWYPHVTVQTDHGDHGDHMLFAGRTKMETSGWETHPRLTSSQSHVSNQQVISSPYLYSECHRQWTHSDTHRNRSQEYSDK